VLCYRSGASIVLTAPCLCRADETFVAQKETIKAVADAVKSGAGTVKAKIKGSVQCAFSVSCVLLHVGMFTFSRRGTKGDTSLSVTAESLEADDAGVVMQEASQVPAWPASLA
jgi:hypothetical protein